MLRRILLLLVAGLLACTGTAAADPGPVAQDDIHAMDGCYTWSRSLSQGASGEDVRQLQIRVSGYPGYGAVVALDGQFGAATRSAVVRFQQAYGLVADGVAGPATFAKVYALQDDDCTPVHFTYGELNRCNSDWSGGKVSATQAKANARVTMWKLEALRHALGLSLDVYKRQRHMYGDAADLGAGVQGFCAIAKQARYHGFTEILGPGYPDHDDHVHTALRSGQLWSAPNCGV